MTPRRQTRRIFNAYRSPARDLEARHELGVRDRRHVVHSRPGPRDGRPGAHQAPARRRALHGARTHRQDGRSRQLRGSRPNGWRRRVRRGRQPVRIHAWSLRHGPGRDRRPARCNRRRRLHHIGRKPTQRAQRLRPLHAAAGAPVWHTLHPVGGGRGPQFEGRRGRRTHGPAGGRVVVALGRAAAQGSGGGRRHGLRRGSTRGLRPDVPLHRHDQGPVADIPLRAARGPACHRRDAGQGGARRLRDARPRERPGGQRGGI